MTNPNLGCGHCGGPLELCDCGSDYEIAWRPDPVDLDESAINPTVQWLSIGAVVLLLSAVFLL